MFKIFANKDFLEGVLVDKAPKNWYNIFMSGNVEEVCVPEDLEEEDINSMGAIDIIGNLQLLGTTVKTDADYINDIPKNSRRVLEHPNAVFILDIEEKDAVNIQNKYGVICQSINAIDDEILTKAYEYDLTDGQEGVDWTVYFDKSNHTIPSNALMICDRYMFSCDSKSGPKVAQEALDSGLTNIRCILNTVLPKKYHDEYNILIIFDSSTLVVKDEVQEDKMFETIANNLRDYAQNIKQQRHYKIRFDLISVDHNCKNYTKLHNRRIISNYFVVRADHKLRAFNGNVSTATQTIFYDAIFSKIVPLKPNGPDSPIKSKLQTIQTIKELLHVGICRKYASVIDKQDSVVITSKCNTCSNRLLF